jgi:hypothetical protein
VKPKHPAGPAMTLGNMRELGVQRSSRGLRLVRQPGNKIANALNRQSPI